jgi:crotonobetaine/carnitine-CoA ligase
MADPLLDIPVRERTIPAMLDRQVAAQPDRVAFVDEGGRELTYATLQQQARRVAAGLEHLGVGRQESVLVMLDGHIDHVLVALGAAEGAIVEVPLNTAFKGDILRHVVQSADASVLVIEASYVERLDVLGDAAPKLKKVVVRGDDHPDLPEGMERIPFDVLLASEPTHREPPEVWEIAAMLFTSGTEGLSKAVRCPHGHALAMASFPPMDGPDEVALVALPLFHAAGLWAGVVNTIRCGGTAVMVGQFSASRFWEQVRRYRATSTVLLGAMVEFLWRQEPSDRDRDHSLRLAVVIPAPPNAAAITERFGFEITSGYGLTEAGTVMISPAGQTKPLGLGMPRDHIDVRLVDENDLEVKRGEVGEIIVRSREPWSIMTGYHGMPDETVRVTRNQWLHSGDAAYEDESGQLIFVDRRKDALRRRGENVSSFEVERAVAERHDVTAVAVVAVPSEHSEDELKAFIVLSDDAVFAPEVILADLFDRLPYFMVPRYYEVIDELPMTQTHKVQKARLRELGNDRAWDCEAVGFRVTRDGLIRPDTNH